MILRLCTIVLFLGAIAACARGPAPYATLGSIVRLDPRMNALVPEGASIEVLDSGFAWSEGPVWVRVGSYLLFSDIPNNVVNRWKEGEGTKPYLKPSGYTGSEPPKMKEPGSNGLTLDSQGRLVLCQHGDRRVARVTAPLTPPTFEALADRYEGKRLNSPNDLVYHSSGALYFTDPPYGLTTQDETDPAKELDFQGVYRLSPDGKLTLLTKEMSRPNGIAFSPDEKTLYVANSDPNRAIWMAFDVKPDGTLANGRVFFDATKHVGQPGRKGLPDGLKVDARGNVFATGPGGVLVFAPDGTQLGLIYTGEKTANCAWGDDGSVLYITAHMHLVRLRTATKGKGY